MQSTTLKVTVPLLGLMNINFFNVAYKMLGIYEELEEINRQKSMRHLGLISTVFDNVSHSRWDYLMLQCGITELVKKMHAGTEYFALGTIKINGKEYDGESVIKTWFMFSNFGHLKNTLGDEKAINLYLAKNKSIKRYVLNKIKDKDLYTYAKSVIEENRYTELHLVLGILRLYMNCKIRILRDEMLLIVKSLLIPEFANYNKVDEQKLTQLKTIYQTIRELSIVAIDSHYSHLPIKVDILNAIVNLNDRKGENKANALKPILEFLNKELYLDKEVLCIQAEHTIKLTEFIQSGEIGYEKLFKSYLFYENDAEYSSKKYMPFTTVILKPIMQSSGNIVDMEKIFRKYLNGIGNVLIDVDKNPINEDIYINIFINKQISQAEFTKMLFGLAEYMESLFLSMIDVNEKDNLEIVAFLNTLQEDIQFEGVNFKTFSSKVLNNVLNRSTEIYLSILRDMFEQVFKDIIKYLLKDNFNVQFMKTKYRHFVYHNKDQQHFLKNDFLDAITNEKDVDRIHEIEQLHKSTIRKFDGYVLLLLCRAKVFDITKAPNQRLQTDIDSMIIKISDDELVIEFNEAKNIKKNRERVAAKDLRDKFVPVLNRERCKYKILHVKGYGAKLKIKFI